MKKVYERIISIIAIISILYMSITMIYATSYTVLVSDDFSHALGVGVYRVGFVEYLKASFAFVKYMYFGWVGSYFGMFLQALLSPVNNFWFRQLKCVMILNSILFYLALVFFAWKALSMNKGEKRFVKLVIIAITVFAICGFQSYPEIFFWYSGAASYTIPLSILLFALVLFLKGFESNNVLHIVGAVVLGVMAMGGSLTLVGMGCFAAFIMCLYYVLKEKSVPIKNVIVLFVWICAAGINALAPGNYARHAVMDQSGVHPLKGLYFSTKMVDARWDYFLKETSFVLILLMVLLIGFMWGKKTDDKRERIIKIVVSFVGLVTPIVAAFPAALGYSSDFMQDRVGFMIDFAIILSSINLANILGRELLGSVMLGRRKPIAISIILIGFVVLILDGFSISDIKVCQVSKRLSDGVYQNHYYACKEFMDSLEEYEEGDDVRISSNAFPTFIDDIYNFSLSDDPSYWINRAVSGYYGFNSISVYQEE